MKLTRSFHVLFVTVALIAGPAGSFGQFQTNEHRDASAHIFGTVKAVTPTSITVETLRHALETIVLDPNTMYTHKDTKALLKELKVSYLVDITEDEVDHKPHAILVAFKTPSEK